MRAGMRLGEALATCPSLVLVDPDPAAAEEEWESVLRRLEDAGFAVETVEPGVVLFETKGVERLYGGVQPALGAGTRRRRNCLGSARGRRAAPVRRSRGGERRAPRADRDRRGGAGARLPRPTAALAPAAGAGALRRARRARRAPARRSRPRCRAEPSRSGWGRRAGGRGGSRAAGSAAAYGGGHRPWSLPRRSPSPRRSQTS